MKTASHTPSGVLISMDARGAYHDMVLRQMESDARGAHDEPVVMLDG